MDELLGNGILCSQTKMLTELFRAMCLCHQVNIMKNRSNSHDEEYRKFGYKYAAILNEEMTQVEFARSQGFEFNYRKRKIIGVNMRGTSERYDELGIIETKAIMGHFMTICALKLSGTKTGVLYMKGSIASLKEYLSTKDNDLSYLNTF